MLPDLVAHRAWNILELVRKKLGKNKVVPAVKNLAMCAVLVAAREAGHEVSDLQVSVCVSTLPFSMPLQADHAPSCQTIIGKPVVHVQSDIRLICQTLEKPYADYRGVNEYALKVIKVADDIARVFLDEIDLSEEITNDKFFRNTQEFCAAYQPHLDTVYDNSKRVERLAEITGVWQNRSADYCTIASVFISLEMAGRKFQHQTRLFTQQLRKHIYFNVSSWQPRTRELQRVAMDLAFYLPQIGKARVMPELVSPWRGRMARPIPIGQVFILLLPDVLDNMDALWEKRELDLMSENDPNAKRDVEVRLQQALSAFLPPVSEVAPSITNESPSGQNRTGATAPCETEANGGRRIWQPVPSAPSLSIAANGLTGRSCILGLDKTSRPCRNRSEPPEPSHASRKPDCQRSNSVPPEPVPQYLVSRAYGRRANESRFASIAALRSGGLPASSSASLLGKRQREPSQELGSGNKRRDMRKKENKVKDPVKEHELRTIMRKRVEQRLTAKQVSDLSRQRNQREVGIGVKNPEYMKSGRLLYGRRRHGMQDTGHFERSPAVIRLLQQWQAREAGSEASRLEKANPGFEDATCSDAWHLRRDLRAGRDIMTIPTYRFPTSVTAAKAMLNDTDIDCPFIGPDDDMYFDDGELNGYLGDEQFQKAKLELWDAQGLDKYIRKEAIYSEKAIEIASRRDPRVASLRTSMRKSKREPVEKMNSARLAKVMVSGQRRSSWPACTDRPLSQESFREDGEEMMEIDPILRKEFGRNLFHAAVEAGAVDDYDRDDEDKDDDYDNREEGNSDKEEIEDKDDHDGQCSEQSGNGYEADGFVAPILCPTEDDAFEVVGDIYDFDVSGYAGYDGCSDGEEY